MVEPVVEVEGLVKRYGELTAVDGIDLTVCAGTVCGLLGRNGAGKTTLLRIILGLMAPDAGQVRLFGRDAGPDDAAPREQVGGFVEEPRFYPYLSAIRNLELFARLDSVGTTAVSTGDALELVGLADRAKEKVRGFSTGMKQRLGIAAALIRRPKLLILDEPTIGLDPSSAASMRTLVRKLTSQGTTVFLSSHNMAEVAEICDSVVIINSGSVVWNGSLDRLREEAPVAAFQLRTTDDQSALQFGHEFGIEIELAASGALLVHADDALRDKFMLGLAHENIAVRRLEPDVSPLESLFDSLTGDRSRS